MDDAKVLKKEVNELLKQKTQLSHDLDEHLRALNEVKLDEEAAKKETEQAVRCRDEAIAEKVKEEKQRDEIVSKLAAVRGELEKETAILGTLRARNETLKEENEDLQLSHDRSLEEERGKVARVMETEFAEANKSLTKARRDIASTVEEVAAMKVERGALADDIDTARQQKSRLAREVVALVSSQSELMESVAALKIEEKDLMAQIEGQKVSSKDLKKEADALAEKAAALTDTISEKTSELTELQNDIDAKKTEYKKEEGKLFALAEREVSLNQREEFIKGKYERAGVVYR